MPMNRKLYPHNWRKVSARIRFGRARNRCEWCGVQNGETGARDKHGKWWNEAELEAMSASVGLELFGTDSFGELRLTRIVLTVAHLGAPFPDGRPGDKANKRDVRAENLAALCQRCHLAYDRQDHIAAARAGREQRRLLREPTLAGLFDLSPRNA